MLLINDVMVIGKVSVDGKELFFEYFLNCNYDCVKAIKAYRGNLSLHKPIK